MAGTGERERLSQLGYTRHAAQLIPSAHQYQVFMPFHHPAPVRVKTTVKLVAIRVIRIVFTASRTSAVSAWRTLWDGFMALDT